jgi:serine/threonine protein kinase/tetratricopeptide (TPR) repeat protein
MDELRRQLESSLVHRYTLGDELGGGGLSRVFTAQEKAIGRTVVIKVLPPELSTAVSAERFRREIDVVGRFQHPFIVPLLDAGDAAGVLYFTMPRIEGESLQARLAREGQLPIRDVVRIVRDVLGALAYAHARGVVHRDIKPANILLSDSHALVADFGIARVLGDAAENRSLTMTGMALGTPAYMAPEQAAAESRMDHRVDLYAVGVMAYEMLAGSSPFAGSTVQHTMARQLTHEPAQLGEVRPAIPAELAVLVHSLLAKRPADRPQTAANALSSLESLGSLDSRPTPAPTQRAWSRWGIAAAAVPVVAIILIARPWSAGRGAVGTLDAPISSIAVMPLESPPLEQEYAYLADVLTDDLINALTRIPGLRTISRNSVFAFKGNALGTRALGDTFDVDALLTGRVWRRGDGQRVLLQLARVETDSTMWSGTFDGALLDNTSLLDSIVRAVTGTMRMVTSSTAPSHAPPLGAIDEEALDLTQRGRALVYARSGLETALTYFGRALEIDSTLSGAWAGKAMAHMIIANDSARGKSEDWELGRRAALRAIQLDSAAADARAALAMIRMTYDRDWVGAETEMSQAIAIRPGYADAHHWRALLLAFQGRMADALTEIGIARELDPLSNSIRNNQHRILLLGGRHDEVVRDLRALVDVDSAWISGLAHALANTGDYSAAIAAHQRGLAASRRSPEQLLSYARTLALAGRRAEATVIADSLRRDSNTRLRPILLASVYVALGRRDDAIKLLQQGVEEQRDLWILELGVSPTWNSLRPDPRFERLLTQLRLPRN